MKKRANVTIIFAIVLLCIIAAVIIVGVSLPERVETIQGEAEMTDYRLSSKVPGRVKEIRVEEGDRVRKGDTLVILEAPDIMAKLGQASAALDAARAVEEKATGSARSEQVSGAYEMWQKAKAGLEVAQKTFDRVEALYRDSVVSAQNMTRPWRSSTPTAPRSAPPRANMTWPCTGPRPKTAPPRKPRWSAPWGP